MYHQLDHSIPSVPLFAGHGTSAIYETERRQQAIRDASSPSALLLLTSCHETFLTELESLSNAELAELNIDLDDFASPHTLLDLPTERYLHHPVISGSALFLFQTTQYLAFIEECATPKQSRYPFRDLLGQNAQHNIGILGFSSGILPACVAGSSATSVTFITRAVEAYKLVLWLGVRTHRYREQVRHATELDSEPSLPWGLVVIGMEQADLEARMHDAKEDWPSLCLTAISSDDCVTISGHPSHLDAFKQTLPSRAITSKTTLDTLYHSPLHHDGARNQVLGDVARRNIQFPQFADIIVPIRSTWTGELLTSSTEGSLVEHVVDLLLLHPVNWSHVMREVLSASTQVPSLRLINFGPGSGLGKSTHRLFPEGTASLLDLTKGITRQNATQDPIAIIGMAVNMPGARDVSKLWQLLEDGINTISEIPEHRFKVSDYNQALYSKTRSMKAHTGNFIDGVDEFDNKFFKISPREAKNMDPQQRVLLHTSYEALEDAGYVPNATPCFDPAMFGTYVGVATHDYIQNLRNEIDVYYSTGTLKAFLSGRIAYAMQMSGPSMVVDTACSSSAVAVYQGCRALMNRDCNAALVGGVNTISSPDMFIGLDRGHFLSPTSQCKAFDASADGYSRSEGCGMFVLKRLSDAIAENDHILGVIRGVEVNQSGRSHSITHPHAPTQASLFERTLRNAGMNADRVNVVEAHGTGTQAGDPNELKSIRSVFASKRSSANPLHITSIKANVGHLEAASGAAGLVKLLLMLQHKQIPRQISLKTLNPSIAPLHQDNTVIDTEHVFWKPSHEGQTRVALLNNFGAAGSNTSLLLEEFVPSSRPDDTDLPCVFGMSAKTEQAVKDLRERYLAWLEHPDNADVALADIAYTSTARRQLYPCRISVSAKTRAELVQKLREAQVAVASDETARVVFVFSGQGGQYLGMGQSLYRSCDVFKKHVDECHAILVRAGFPGVLGILNPSADGSGLEELEEFEAYQAAIFTLEYALAQLWISWGLKPMAVVGHSLGEYTAMVTAGVLTVRDALLIVATRVRLMVTKCSVNETGMIAINLAPDAVTTALSSSDAFSELTIACFNTPTDCVVSGPLSQLKALKAHLDAEIHCKSVILNVPFGYHSRAMEPLLEELTAFCKRRTFRAPNVPIISNVLGSVVLPGDKAVFNAEYFAQHCAQPVQFNKGIDSLVMLPEFAKVDAWIEVGPHTATLPMLKSNAKISQGSLLLGSLKKQQDPWTTITSTLSQLFLSVTGINWRQVFAHRSAACIRLPSYPFAKTKFWVHYEEAEPSTATEEPSAPDAPQEHLIPEFTMLRRWMQQPDNLNDFTAVFETPISELASSIVGHSVGDMPLCPASVYIEQVLAGIQLGVRHLKQSIAGRQPMLKNVEFAKPLVYNAEVARTVVTTIVLEDGCGSFSVGSRVEPSSEVSVHVTGEYKLHTTSSLDTKFSRALPLVNRQMEAVIEARSDLPPEVFSTRTIYEVVFPRVVDYAKEYRTVQTLTVGHAGMEGCATVRLPAGYHRGDYVVHPVFMDTLLHVAGFVANLQGGVNDAYICIEVGSVKVNADLVDNDASYAVYCNNTWLPDEGIMLAEAYAIKAGEPKKIVAHLKGLQFRRVRLNGLKRSLAHAAGQALASSIPSASAMVKPRSLSSASVGPLVRMAAPPSPISRVASPSRDSGSTEQILVEVLKIVAGTCDLEVSSVHPSTDLTSLGVDSLMYIEILTKLQESFTSTSLDTHALASCQSVNDIVRAISTMDRTPSSSNTSPRTLVHDELTLADSDGVEHLSLDGEPDIKEVLANVLGISIHEIDDEAELESLGLDSLTSIEALHTLKDSFGLQLSSSFFCNYPTVSAVKCSITDQLKARDIGSKLVSDAPKKVESSIDRVKAFLRLNTIPTLIQSASRPGNTLPLFLIHDGSGLVNYYERLGHLDRTIWAIYNPHFLTAKPWDSLTQMATAYTSYIMSKSSGPILLGGWSFGGIAAYEIARQLRAKGITVKGILLIDSPSPTNHVPLSDSLLDSVLFRAPANDLSPLIMAQFRMSPRLIAAYRPQAMADTQPIPAVMLYSTEGYNPLGVPNVPKWIAERGTKQSRREAVEGWEKLFGTPVKMLDIPGNHFDAFHPSNMSEISDRIAQACEYLEKPDL